MAIGDSVLDPTFDKDVTVYETTTENATDTITATPKTEGDTVSISVNGETLEDTTATWEEGENEVVVTVGEGDSARDYTVTVTYEAEAGGEEETPGPEDND